MKNFQMFYYTLFKTHFKIAPFFNITNQSHQKVFNYRKAFKLKEAGQMFQNCNFCSKGNKYFQLFSLKEQAHFIHLRKCLPEKIVCPSAVPSSIHEKMQLIQLAIKIIAHKCFSLKIPLST